MPMIAPPFTGLHCEVWQPQDFSGEDSSSGYPEFFIDLYVSSYTSESSEIVRVLCYRNFRQRCDFLVQDILSWSTISNMLSAINVPYHLQPFFIQQISTHAREIAGEPENACCKTIPVVVELIVPQEALEVSVETEGDQALEKKQGRKSSMEAVVERVEIIGIGEQCAICLEEMEDGCVAARLPCRHWYHEACIVNWLVKSNLCPLCRFQMPVKAD